MKHPKTIFVLSLLLTLGALGFYLSCSGGGADDAITCFDNAACPASCSCETEAHSCVSDDYTSAWCTGNTCIEDSDCNPGETCRGNPKDTNDDGFTDEMQFVCEAPSDMEGIWEEVFTCVIEDAGVYDCSEDVESATFEITGFDDEVEGRQTSPVVEVDPTFGGSFASGAFIWANFSTDEEGCWSISADGQSAKVRTFGTSAGNQYVCVGNATKGAGTTPGDPLDCAELSDQMNDGDLVLATDFGTPGDPVCPPAP